MGKKIIRFWGTSGDGCQNFGQLMIYFGMCNIMVSLGLDVIELFNKFRNLMEVWGTITGAILR